MDKAAGGGRGRRPPDKSPNQQRGPAVEDGTPQAVRLTRFVDGLRADGYAGVVVVAVGPEGAACISSGAGSDSAGIQQVAEDMMREIAARDTDIDVNRWFEAGPQG